MDKPFSLAISPRTLGVDADRLRDDDMEPLDILRRRAAARDAEARDMVCCDGNVPGSVYSNGAVNGLGTGSMGDGDRSLGSDAMGVIFIESVFGSTSRLARVSTLSFTLCLFPAAI